MSNILRKYKRNILKKELGTNEISDEFHNRFGYHQNITKQELKLKERLLRRLRKLAHKKSRKSKQKKEK